MEASIDPAKITKTALQMAEKIRKRFPDSGLALIGTSLAEAAADTEVQLERLRRPDYRVRVLVGLALTILLAGAVVVPVVLKVRADFGGGIGDLLQGVEAGVNNLVFIGIAVYFLVTLEIRPKRKRALAELHELRSIAHLIDMHQLGKDPEQLLFPDHVADRLEPPRLDVVDMIRYLDYCSDLLSITSKLAALYAHYLNDELVLNSVNDVEQLAGTLSAKIWQKIMILNATAQTK